MSEQGADAAREIRPGLCDDPAPHAPHKVPCPVHNPAGTPEAGTCDDLYDCPGVTAEQPHWDGPRASNWVRPGKAFTPYPAAVFSRNLFGQPLYLGPPPPPLCPALERHRVGYDQFCGESRWCPRCSSYERACGEDHCMVCGEAT